MTQRPLLPGLVEFCTTTEQTEIIVTALIHEFNRYVDMPYKTIGDEDRADEIVELTQELQNKLDHYYDVQSCEICGGHPCAHLQPSDTREIGEHG